MENDDDAYERFEVVKTITRVDERTTNPVYPLDPSLPREGQVMLDNCAGRHLFHSESFFIKWNDDPTHIDMQVAAGSPRITCDLQGTVVFVDMDTGEIEELKDVMYHEKSNDNIISEGQWAKDNAGYEFIVRGEDHLIVKPGQPPRRTRKIGNHGMLRARPLNATEKKKCLRDRLAVL